MHDPESILYAKEYLPRANFLFRSHPFGKKQNKQTNKKTHTHHIIIYIKEKLQSHSWIQRCVCVCPCRSSVNENSRQIQCALVLETGHSGRSGFKLKTVGTAAWVANLSFTSEGGGSMCSKSQGFFFLAWSQVNALERVNNVTMK